MIEVTFTSRDSQGNHLTKQYEADGIKKIDSQDLFLYLTNGDELVDMVKIMEILSVSLREG